MDGAIGDNFYFFNFDKAQELKVDMAKDHHKLIELVIDAEETGMIILGSGVVKHTICNANMFREGAKYAVYINTAPEYDGSDSGAEPEEAKSWGKIQGKAETVKVFGDATILFPLIVASAFYRDKFLADIKIIMVQQFIEFVESPAKKMFANIWDKFFFRLVF